MGAEAFLPYIMLNALQTIYFSKRDVPLEKLLLKEMREFWLHQKYNKNVKTFVQIYVLRMFKYYK